MYYATPAPPPVGDLGPEFESGLDLVLKKTPLDHFTLEKKTNVEIIRPLHKRDYLRRLVGGQCPVPLTVRGTQALVSFAPLAFKLFFAARQNAVLRRSSFPSP